MEKVDADHVIKDLRLAGNDDGRFIVVNYRNMIIRKQHNDNKQKSRTMNINQFIFSRTQPKKKLEVIEALTTEELLSVKEETVIKIVKEVGRRVYKSRDKQLYIDGDRRKGNGWNSTIEGVDLIKGRIHLNIYIQYENTDTNSSEEFDKFFDKWNCYRGEIRRLDRHGNGRTYYFNYDKSDKAQVMKSILMEYVYSKYADKLKDEP